MNKKFEQQDNEYSFPYHYNPHFVKLKNGKQKATISRLLYWGFAYLAKIDLFVSEIVKLNPKRVLDVGCGDARLLHTLKNYLPHQNLHGVDLSERGIAFAKAFNPTLDIKLADITKTVYDEKFDCIVLMEVLEHIPDDFVAPFLQGIANNLSDDGVLFLSVPHINLKLQSKHYRHYTMSLLKQHLDSANMGLQIVSSCHTFHQSKFYNLYLRLTKNKYFKIEVFDNMFYNHLRKNLITTEDKGNGIFVKIIKGKDN